MSTRLHSLIIEPGSWVNYYCVDGLTSMEKLRVANILNFGGHLRSHNCGAAQEFVTLDQASFDMFKKFLEAPRGSKARDDFKTAFEQNKEARTKFTTTDLFKKWVGNRNQD